MPGRKMKSFAAIAMIISAVFAGTVMAGSTNVLAPDDSKDIILVQAINWAQCWVNQPGRALIIQNGSFSQARCHDLAKKCTGDQNVTSNYRSEPVLVNRTFAVCNAN
jgi:hypothetical protein